MKKKIITKSKSKNANNINLLKLINQFHKDNKAI